MNTDVRSKSLNYKTAAVVIGIPLCITAVPFLWIASSILIGLVQIHAKRHMLIRHVDHMAVREAARSCLADRETGTIVPPDQLPDAKKE